MRMILASILMVVALAGCASTPDVVLTYHPPKWSATATVTQTIACDATKSNLVISNAPSVAAAYSSDFTKSHSIGIKKLDGIFSDSDLTMAFTEDGRLKSINQSSTGQGETILKSAMALMTTGKAAIAMVPPKPADECAIVEAWGGGKPVSLSYKNSVDNTSLGKTVGLTVAPESEALYGLIKAKLSPLTLKIGDAKEIKGGPSYTPATGTKTSDVVALTLQEVASVTIVFDFDGKKIGSSDLVVPTEKTYELPIPKAALFGKQAFTIVLSDAGAVTSIGYGKTAGAAGAMNSLSTLAATQTPAAQAADLKAEADLIAQQQRLVLCKAKPQECK